MSAPPLFPFAPLLAQLEQAMSAPGSPPVRHEATTQRDAGQTGDDRVTWITTNIETVTRPFALPDGVTPMDQAWDNDVTIYGSSLARAAQLHALLAGWIDLLIGPEQGAAPSPDASPAIVSGTVDLTSLLYPTSILDGLSLTFTAPLAMTVAMPTGPLASWVAIMTGINNALRAAGSPVLASVVRGDSGERYLSLVLAGDVLSTDAPTIALDPDAADSACAALGFDATPAVGAAPSNPYRPGYKIGKAEGPTGGTIDAGAWAIKVPVRLFAPIYSQVDGRAPILSVASTVYAATDTGEDLALSNP